MNYDIYVCDLSLEFLALGYVEGRDWIFATATCGTRRQRRA
jgi:hypothetical protein